MQERKRTTWDQIDTAFVEAHPKTDIAQEKVALNKTGGGQLEFFANHLAQHLDHMIGDDLLPYNNKNYSY